MIVPVSVKSRMMPCLLATTVKALTESHSCCEEGQWGAMLNAWAPALAAACGLGQLAQLSLTRSQQLLNGTAAAR